MAVHLTSPALRAQIIHDRIRQGLTVAELAALAGVSVSTVYRLLRPKHLVRTRSLGAVFSALRYTSREVNCQEDASSPVNRSTRFRGGRQSRRDHEYTPFRDGGFRRWWHRVGKPQRGGRDLSSEREAREAFADWKADGSPIVRLLTTGPVGALVALIPTTGRPTALFFRKSPSTEAKRP